MFEPGNKLNAPVIPIPPVIDIPLTKFPAAADAPGGPGVPAAATVTVIQSARFNGVLIYFILKQQANNLKKRNRTEVF